MRDIRQTPGTFAARACAPVALCALLLFALHATAGSVLAQDKATEEQEKVLKESGVQRPVVNTMPWTELARKGKQLYDERRLDAFTRIDLTASAERQEDGTLKPDSVVMTWKSSSDEAVASLAQQLITAISQSKILLPLEGARAVSIRLKLDDTNALLSVSSAMPSAERAKQLADGYGVLLKFATTQKKGTREGALYEGVRFASDEKLFTFTFEMSKERLGDIIMEMLAKRDAAAHS